MACLLRISVGKSPLISANERVGIALRTTKRRCCHSNCDGTVNMHHPMLLKLIARQLEYLTYRKAVVVLILGLLKQFQ